MTDNPRNTITTPDDLEAILDLLGVIRGEVCQDMVTHFGGILYLDFGPKVLQYSYYKQKKVSERLSHKWSIGVLGTSWHIQHKDKMLMRYEHTTDLPIGFSDEKDKLLLGHAVTSIAIAYETLGLQIGFSNDYLFCVNPQPVDDSFVIGYWELSTPENLLTVGPNRHWRYDACDTL